MPVIILIILLVIFLVNPLLGAGAFLVVAWHRTTSVQQGPTQAQFLAGHVPSSLSGFYKGSTDFYHANWQGKKIDSANNSGINIFMAEGVEEEKFPFKTYVGKGLRDSEIDVFKIDYRTPGNPFYVRPILDEVVEVEPGKYLGKIHYRLIPGFPFAIGYFRLEK